MALRQKEASQMLGITEDSCTVLLPEKLENTVTFHSPLLFLEHLSLNLAN